VARQATTPRPAIAAYLTDSVWFQRDGYLAVRRTQAVSTDGCQFSGDAVRFLHGGQWRRCAGKALSAEFKSEAPRRSRQMVPHSMNGAYSDRGSHECFAIRLPDAIYPEQELPYEPLRRSVDAQNPQAEDDCRR
jgi:hypothetical protein